MTVLENKRVLLTGASDGIGAALARALGAAGARVALFARRRERLEEVAAALRNEGGEALVLPGDVTAQDDVDRAIQRVLEEWDGVDVVIANAGVGYATSIRRLDTALMLRTIEVNLSGAIRTINAALPHMLEAGQGHIVGVASPAAKRGLPIGIGYSASKAGLSSYLESLRGVCRPRGVIVTTVHPGYVRTPLTAKNKAPMPFLMEPEDAAQRIIRAIRRDRRELTFPWQMATVMRLVRSLPNALYDVVARRLT